MRIAHVITRMIIGGAQENTLMCCQDLMRLFGDEVLLVTGPSTGPEGSLLDLHIDHGVPLALVQQLRRSIAPWRDVSSYFELRRVLRDFQPDVAHTHSAKGGLLGRLAAASIGVPVIVHTVHGAPFHSYQNAVSRSFFRCCERYAATKCHALVSVADAMTDLLVNAGVASREKFTTIYSGMDVAPYASANDHRQLVRQRLGFAEEHLVVGKIARLFHLKGHEYVIDAASRVLAAHPETRFLFVGDGILHQQLQDRIRTAGLSDRFLFTGLVSPDEIPALIGAMDVVVHTSLREGLARTLPQALIAGKPVVSFDVDGAREVVINDQTGYLVRPKDVQGLSEALIRLAANRKLRDLQGQQGRELLTERFCRETMTRRLRSLYEHLLAQAVV